jgi:adenosine deaminase
LQSVYQSAAYLRLGPAARLALLDQQVSRLTEDRGIFRPEVFAEVVRRLCQEMTGSGVNHVDLRVGVIMHRWPWITSLPDAVTTFRAAMPGPDTLTVSFLGAVSLSRPSDVLDTVLGRIAEDAAADGLLAGLDITLQPGDLPALDRYLNTLLDFQRGGLRVNIHLGELFGAGFSRLILSRIIPCRIGHGVLLLDDPQALQLIRDHEICLDMCPVSNTRLGVWDWTSSSPAVRAMRLGLPVTINTDDPVLLGAGLPANLALAGLSPAQLESARHTASTYGHRR